jgi:glycosyltransferase involved in cell wall biosynthesis
MLFRFKLLGVLLCYNDADILEDAILHLLKHNHDLIVWDHGSDDETPEVLNRYQRHFRERKFIPRSFDFYELHAEMSRHLIKNYIRKYDWISWPDQDELLEGPDRTQPYDKWLKEIHRQGYSYIQFNNYNFWYTSADDPKVLSPAQRIRHYALFPDCAPRIRAWRASKTNIRKFNHNAVGGTKAGQHFNLRHYPMRTEVQMLRRIQKDRAGLQRGGSNYHYNNMAADMSRLIIAPESLYADDGVSELNPDPIFNWKDIYGYGPRND